MPIKYISLNQNIKRIIDLALVFFAIFLSILPMIIISILVKITSPGPSLYWSDIVGQYNKIFQMPKFRTMFVDTPQVATHLLENPSVNMTKFGSFLRKYSLDELPQLYCILKGLMSFVGPRPALYNQKDLIDLRKKAGVDKLLPGLTGWAQVNGRDDLSIQDKFSLDEKYLERRSILFDVYIIWLTFLKVLRRDGVSH